MEELKALRVYLSLNVPAFVALEGAIEDQWTRRERELRRRSIAAARRDRATARAVQRPGLRDSSSSGSDGGGIADGGGAAGGVSDGETSAASSWSGEESSESDDSAEDGGCRASHLVVVGSPFC